MVEFKFDSSNDKAPKSIKSVSEVKAYVVDYTDGESKDQVRICFRTADGQATYVLQERISGSFVATGANKWFHKALSDKIDGLTKGAVESI